MELRLQSSEASEPLSAADLSLESLFIETLKPRTEVRAQKNEGEFPW